MQLAGQRIGEGTEAMIVAERLPGPTSETVVSAALSGGTRPIAPPPGISTRSAVRLREASRWLHRSPRATAVWNALSPQAPPRRSSAFWRSSSNAANAAVSPAARRSSALVVTLRSATGTESPERGSERHNGSAKNVPTSLNLKLPSMFDPSVSPTHLPISPLGSVFGTGGRHYMRSILRARLW